MGIKGRTSKLLSRAEEIVLLAAWQLQDNAYGVTIRALISEATGYPWSIGAVYAPLYRLERKGLVRMIPGEPTPERGGRSKIYYALTPEGKKALLRIKRVHNILWGETKPIQVDEM
jgi:DNA-binding PadR family transcriptional regulator